MLDMIYFINENNRAKAAIEEQLISSDSTLTKLKNDLLRRDIEPKPTEAYYELKKRFDNPQKINELIDFIIEHYYREQSLYLVKLVSRNYQKVKSWIDGMEK